MKTRTFRDVGTLQLMNLAKLVNKVNDLLISPFSISFSTSFRIEGKAKPHPKYNGDNYENDVAIVKLDKEINFKDFSGTVVPVCLARYGEQGIPITCSISTTVTIQEESRFL